MNMKTNRSTYLVAAMLLFTLALAGCRSSRNATDETGPKRVRKQENEFIVPLAQYPEGLTSLTAKTSISLNYNGMSATVKGRLRMRRDEAVQMTITALGFMDVAFIEFTPQGVCIVDKINKRYAELDYSSGVMHSIGADFSTIQALFWNRIFIPGKENPWTDLDDFTYTQEPNRRLIEPSRQRMLLCSFYTDKDGKQLQQTNLNLRQYNGTWQYGTFSAFDTYTLPATHDISFSGASRALGAQISLTNISITDSGWKSGINLNSYKQVDLEQLLNILNMLR